MRQVRFDTFGEPERVLRCVAVEEPPPPGEGEVAVRIQAFPINPADLLTATGEYGRLPALPATLGAEAAGRIVETGPGVTELADGDRVILLQTGNWSELRTVPATSVMKVPSQADLLQLAMLKVNPATAYLLLRQVVDLATGDVIIQNVANSGVGRAVAMIGRAFGYRVLNVVRRQAAAEALRGLGETGVLVDGPNLADEASKLLDRPPRLALDAVAGTATARLADCLADGGTIVNYGRMSMDPCHVRPDQLIFRNVRLCGFWLSRFVEQRTAAQLAPMYDRLATMILRGELSVPVEAVYPIEEIAQAAAHARRGERSGKILVSID